MATIMTREIHPQPPEKFNPADVVVRYDDVSDTLFVHLTGTGQRGVSVPVDDSEFFRVDPVTEQIIGIQLEDFLAETVYKGGPFLTFAELAEVDPETLNHVREEIEARQRALGAEERKRVAVEAFFATQLASHAV